MAEVSRANVRITGTNRDLLKALEEVQKRLDRIESTQLKSSDTTKKAHRGSVSAVNDLTKALDAQEKALKKLETQ